VAGSADRPVVPVWRDAVLESDLAAREKLVALAVAYHVDGQGRGAWPSHATLGRLSSYSRESARQAIDTLDSCGWLKVERRGAVRRPNLYSLTFPKGQTRAFSKPGRKGKEADGGNADLDAA
jgi:hypothetical protein